MARVSFNLLLSVLLLFLLRLEHISGTQITGPIFIKEPKPKIEFLNSQGAVLDCLAHGEPQPKITWRRQTGIEEMEQVENKPSFLDVYTNGSVAIHSFASDRYRQEIHAAVYRCVASNNHGTIVSHMVSVKATTDLQQQQLQAQVYDEYVIAGNTAVLTCHIPPFYKDDLEIVSWIREDNLIIKPNARKNELEIANNGQLLIHNVSPKMNVELGFWCQIKNKLTGETFLSQSAGRIKITEHQGGVPPTISHISETVSVKVGQSAELSCAGQGYPPPIYKWKSSTEGRIVARSSKFRFENTATAGTFTYVCKVENKFGIDESKVKVVVREPLEAFIHPNFQIVNSGEEINLECKINGHPVAEVAWRRNGQLINENEASKTSKHKLKIKSAKKQHEGMYQCMVKNSWESIQTAAQVQLGDMAPTFIRTFKSKKLQPGPSISLKCIAVGRPSPRIKWKVNGVVIETNSKFVIREESMNNGTTVSSVVVKSITSVDGGEYDCTASNKVDSVRHAQALNVYGPPSVHDIENRTVAAGESVTIKCYVSGYPITSTSWNKDARRFYQRLQQSTVDNQLTLLNVTEKDEGYYTCKAENGRGLSSEKKMFINVIKKPVLSPLPLPPEILPARSPYSTFCSVFSGDPPMTLTWLKNGVDASMIEKVDVTNTKTYSLLQIHEVSTEHSGNYTCVAENKAGKSVKSIVLKVASSPKWLVEPNNVKARLNTDVLMHCKAEAYPVPKVKWFRHVGRRAEELSPVTDDNIKHFKNGTIKILASNSKIAGNFSCLVSNGIEPDLMKLVSLSIIDPLKISVKQLRNKENVAKIECRVHGGEGVNITWRNSNGIISSSSKRFSSKIKKSGQQSTSTLVINNPKNGEMFKCSASITEESVEKAILLAVKEVKMSNNRRKNNRNKLKGNVVKATTSATTTTTSNEPSPKTTTYKKTKKMEKIQRQGDESVVQVVPPHGKKSNIESELKEPTSKFSTTQSGTDGTKTSLMTLLLFVLPSVAVFVLLILLIITLAAYLVTKRRNHRTREENIKLECRGLDTLNRSSMNRKRSAPNMTSLDRRYGKLDKPLRISGNDSEAEYQNTYEIPDYYAGMKPYSTLQFSSRNPVQTNSMPRCSQASL